MKHTVTIIRANPPAAPPAVDPDRLPMEDEDDIKWVTRPAGLDFDVEFADGPFNDDDFHKHKPDSGKPKKKGEFKYRARVAGSAWNDPTVIIR